MTIETIMVRPVKAAPWNDPTVRGWAFQIAVVVAVGVGLFDIVSNTVGNLQHQKIASGFGYLWQEAGFEIGDSMIPYASDSTYGRAILVGLLNTLRVSVLGIVLATVLGTALGLGLLSPNWLLARICRAYVELFRNVPVLLWLILFYKLISEALPGTRQALRMLWDTTFLSNRGLYFPVPMDDPAHSWMGFGLLAAAAATWLVRRWARARQAATGRSFPIVRVGTALTLGVPIAIWLAAGAPHRMSWPELKGFNFAGGMVVQPEFAALLAALVLYFAAFIADIVRSGILSVDKGQGEAAAAVGLARGQGLYLVVLPQAMRVIVPPMTNQYLRITRSSSLAIAVGYPDLVATLNVTINQTGQAIENVLLIVAAYLTVSLSISLFMHWYDRRMALTER